MTRYEHEANGAPGIATGAPAVRGLPDPVWQVEAITEAWHDAHQCDTCGRDTLRAPHRPGCPEAVL